MKIYKSFRIPHNILINSLCLLKDKRLVSSTNGANGSIIVYDRLYEIQICIRNPTEGFSPCSLCVLKNGDLVSSAYYQIKIWRINENDYQLIHMLSDSSNCINKIIELEDGKIASCSSDKTIKIWDYDKCIQTLAGHTWGVISIIEMKNFIVSTSSYGDDCNELMIWDESTYHSIANIKNVQCISPNGLSNLNDNTCIVGGKNLIYLIDIKTHQINKIKNELLGDIYCLNVKGNALLFIGNHKGEIISYNLTSNQIIFKNKFHNGKINCLLESEDNKLISSSTDRTINVYT